MPNFENSPMEFTDFELTCTKIQNDLANWEERASKEYGLHFQHYETMRSTIGWAVGYIHSLAKRQQVIKAFKRGANMLDKITVSSEKMSSIATTELYRARKNVNLILSALETKNEKRNLNAR